MILSTQSISTSFAGEEYVCVSMRACMYIYMFQLIVNVCWLGPICCYGLGFVNRRRGEMAIPIDGGGWLSPGVSQGRAKESSGFVCVVGCG